MATYYVDGNAGSDSAEGSSNRPWKTLNKAGNSIQPGDEVRVRTATYHEELSIRVSDTTWKADTGHKPVIDGRYHDGLFSGGKLPHPQPGAGFMPQTGLAAMVVLRADGIVFDGFTVQNVAGTAIGGGKSRCVVRNCRIDFVYGTAVRMNPGGNYIDGVVVENNVCTRISVRYYDPDRTDGNSESVSGVLKMGRTRDGIIRNNICAYGHGEGINVGKGNYRVLVEGNVVHTCNHIHIYINRSVDTTIRNNLIYHLYTRQYLGSDGRPPAGIAVGDEHALGRPWPHSSGGQIYNNLVIGLGTLFHVRNNERNYDTQADKLYVGYNTFVGGEKTLVGIQINANRQGRPHVDSLFENNIIALSQNVSRAGDVQGFAFRNNLWSAQPEAAMRGPGDRIGNPGLVNPTAVLVDDYPNPHASPDPRDYQLTERSSLAIGMASDGSRFNNLQPPEVRKDFFGANRDSRPDIGAHEFNGVVPEITANFSIGSGQAAGPVPHSVDFVDKSTSARAIVAWLWDFGDGETSTERSPSHTYTKEGSYDVTLTVTDDKGASDTLTLEGLIATVERGEIIVPPSFRRFVVLNSDGTATLAFGVQYPDLRCVLVWNAEPFHMLNYSDIAGVERSIGLLPESDLRWVDTGDEDMALISDDEAEEEEALELF